MNRITDIFIALPIRRLMLNDAFCRPFLHYSAIEFATRFARKSFAKNCLFPCG